MVIYAGAQFGNGSVAVSESVILMYRHGLSNGLSSYQVFASLFHQPY